MTYSCQIESLSESMNVFDVDHIARQPFVHMKNVFQLKYLTQMDDMQCAYMLKCHFFVV